MTKICLEDTNSGLKTDLHMHTKEDKLDRVPYSGKDLIDKLSEKGFEVISFSFHDQAFYDKEIFNYAKKKGILMIPGTERKIKKKEVLIYAKSPEILKETLDINSFEDLRSFRKKHGKNILIIAPHPFFITTQCIGKKLVEYADLFDGVEYSHFYCKLINRNKPAVRFAEKNNKTVVGNSDIHRLYQVGLTYSRIDSKKDIISVFSAVRAGKVKVISKPLSLLGFLKIAVSALFF